ncbi:outer membrane protein assembly factor BamA [Candidatus Palibaumannia cicadellinicola]|uniref:Outer membrane protein assembly factor BamA n=1 Tax=Candidatus Palibaumannia cicadellinicola TaxID=186490 RepID=A0A0K2BLK7_9GAMM|nr:outer membrane protein assembly factor BamA [Candidatus Baumannia cicadellinicola]AKZ66067.1 Outer membrane protein assembly factor YaeT precursor [Candidatus Baumannia cicadellinicola]
MNKLIIIVLFFFSTTLYSSQNIFTIKNINFDGLKRITVSSALLMIPISVGHNATNEDIDNTIRSLFSTGNFNDIRVIRNGSSITIKVKECPIIANITLSGNQLLNNDQLIHYLDQYGINLGKVLNSTTIFHIEKALNNLYDHYGKYNSTVKAVVIPLQHQRVNLKLVFTEGKSAKIKKINIIGNKAFSTKELISQLKLHDHVPWWNFIGENIYKKIKFDRDIETLRKFYFDHGYARFKINSTNVQLTPDKNMVDITINIREGTPYQLEGTILYGNLAGKYAEIKKLATFNKGELYSITKVNNIAKQIQMLLGSYGYAYPNVVTKMEINELNKKVILHIRVDSGIRFYVRNIIFKGNYITKDLVLRREIRQMERSWLNMNLVNQGKNSLNRLGYFEKVEIKIDKIPESLDLVDVVYSVKERNTGTISAGIGFGTTDSGINFNFGIQQDNWLGTGNLVGFSGTKNYYHTSMALSITDSYLTLDGVSLSSKIFVNNYNSNYQELSNYHRKKYGLSTLIGFPIKDNQAINLGLDYVNNAITNIKPQVAICRYFNRNNINTKAITRNKNQDELDFYADDLFFNIIWEYNKLNRKNFPTIGSRLTVSNKITVPSSDNKYYKINLDACNYTSLSNDNHWVLLERASAGYAHGLYGQEVPFYDNFYAGGFSTMRGFRTNSIGPKAAYYRVKNNSCFIENSNDTIGGNAIALASAELIVPTPLLKDKYDHLVRTSFFIDMSNVWDTYWKNTYSTNNIAKIPDYTNSSNIRISSGIAIQWMSPLGPIVFSYAQPITKYKNDKSEQFQLTIGKNW